MSITLNEELASNPDYLLRLFQQDLQRRLVAAGIEAVRPAITAAAHEAVLSLEAKIRAHHDVRADQLLVQLLIKPEAP